MNFYLMTKFFSQTKSEKKCYITYKTMHPLVMVCPIITNQNLEQLGCTAAKYKWYTYQKWHKKGDYQLEIRYEKKNKFEKKKISLVGN